MRSSARFGGRDDRSPAGGLRPLHRDARLLSEELQKIGEIYDAWGVGDFTPGADLWHPDVDFVIGPDFPDPGLYKGLEGILRYMTIFLEPWDRLTIEAIEMEQVGDSVVALVRQAGTGKGSGAETEFRYWQVWTFAGGKVVHWQNYRDREGAIAAAEATSA